MKAVLAGILVIVIGIQVSADEPKVDDVKQQAIEKALETFAGTWEITIAQPKGIAKDARRLVFRKDMTYAALDREGKELWTGTFDLDPLVTPKIWDHRTLESKEKGADALGIYELDGDTLKVCCVVGIWKDQQWSGKPRPTEFKLPAAEVVLKLRRVKSEKP